MRLTNCVLCFGVLGLIAGGCSSSSPNPNDGSSPSVQITAPLPGADVGRQVSIDVNASDDFGVDVVRFLVDDVLLTEQFTPPFHAVWNTSAVPDSSSHTIRVEALDLAKNKGFQSITVRVVKGTQ
jgi:hypothetical protein